MWIEIKIENHNLIPSFKVLAISSDFEIMVGYISFSDEYKCFICQDIKNTDNPEDATEILLEVSAYIPIYTLAETYQRQYYDKYVQKIKEK